MSGKARPDMKGNKQFQKPESPGTILKEEFIKPLGISQNELARAIDVPPNRINVILQSKRVISADTALRLARYFHNTPGFWMNLQSHYEIECAKEKSGKAIGTIKPFRRSTLQTK